MSPHTSVSTLLVVVCKAMLLVDGRHWMRAARQEPRLRLLREAVLFPQQVGHPERLHTREKPLRARSYGPGSGPGRAGPDVRYCLQESRLHRRPEDIR